MAIDMTQFYQLFFEEAAEHLATIESSLLAFDPAAPDAEQVDAVFRAAHSIKGSAATFGFHDMAEVTHQAEALLDRVRRKEMTLDREMLDALLFAGDVLKTLLAGHTGQGSADATGQAQACARLRRLLERPAAAAAAGSPAAVGGDVPAAAGFEAADGSFGLFADAAGAPPAEAAPETAAPASEASLRVGSERVDLLLNLVGELVIARAALADAAGPIDPLAHERLFAGLAQLERTTREMQEAVMRIRMVPVARAFGRFPRLVRDLALKLGKELDLRLVGEATELDKGMVEKLTDPLTHLVRNCLDHGIEPPAVRLAAGKPARGALTLSARQRGGGIVIEVSDDGAGLDRARILAKAREQGRTIDPMVADAEVWQLIFAPGFSTAASVTELSGRGVGMDVVRRNIAELGGRIEVASAPGHGTRFTLHLPLTLAVTDGMVVGVGAERYVVPLDCVVESGQPAPGQVRAVRGGRALAYELRGDYLPLIEVGRLLGLPGCDTPFERGIVVAVNAGGTRQALFVDRLLGQQQFVVKSLEPNLRKPPAFAGATLLGDGCVAMILDVEALPALAGERLALAA